MVFLVTGASGFIGSHLCDGLKKTHKVVALVRDHVPSKWLDEALEGCIKVRGDVNDYFGLLRMINQYEVDGVFHLAAQSIVKTAYRDPVNCFQTNIMGTVNVLEACRQVCVKKVLIQSTDKVYGNRKDAGTCDPVVPTEPYGTSKAAADLIAQTYANTYNMNVVVSRCCNVYGYDLSNRIVPNTVRSCLLLQSPIIYKNDNSKRQYIYISDVVKSLTFLMKEETKGVYNIGTYDILNQSDVVLEILKFFPSLAPKYVEKPGLREIFSQSLHPSLPTWEPVSFEEGIKLTINDFRKYGW